MMSITHATIALATTSVSLGTANPYTLLASLIGSQLPDLDTTESFMGRILYPIAALIEKRFPHRTITHSFLATGIVAIAAAPLAFLHWHYWAGITLGHFIGWFSDTFTRAGVSAFYPNPAKLVIPGNPRARLRSGSSNEYWVLGIAALLTIISLNLISAGGITEQFARAFFSDARTAADLFYKHGAERLIQIEIKGMHSATGESIRGNYSIIEATNNDLIAENLETGKLYKIGNSTDAQIRPTHVKTEVLGPVNVRSQEMNLQDIPIADWLQRIPQNAYISGSLWLDDMSEVRIPTEIETFPSVRAFGGQIELSNARPAQISSLLREFWIVQGKTIVKIRS
jgi:inner membrane protein